MWDPGRKTENVWLSIADLPQSLHAVADDSKEYVSDLAAKRMRLIPKGTLLVSFKLTLGRLAYAGRNLFSNEAIASLLDINEKQLSKEFLYWALTAFDWNKAAEGDQKVKGKTLNKAKLKTIPIPLPPLKEQQRIVAVLDEAFEGLARARAHAEANVKNTNELFRNTLAQRTNSEDFPRVMLSEVCDVRDGTHDTPKYVDEGVPLVTQKNIRPEGLSLENVKLISLDDHTAIHRRSNVAEGDILISMIGVNRGMSCLVDRDDVFSIKNVGLIKDTPELNMGFLLYYLKSADAEKYVEEATNGGAQPFIGLAKLRAFPTPLPERAVQDRIAAEITEMREAVQALEANYEAQIKDFDDLRQSLLQKAFAGELT